MTDLNKNLSDREIERIMTKAEEMTYNQLQDGIRLVEYQEDGVYLTVFPPQHGGNPLTPEELIKDIETRKIEKFDMAKIRQAAQEMTGQPVYIAPPQTEVIQDAIVKVETSKNKMEAYLTVYPPRGGKEATKQDVVNALKEKDIVYGIKEEIIDFALGLQQVSEPLTVAKGINPVDGQNARIEYKFGNEGLRGKPTELLNGRVDFYNLNLIQNVEQGEILAVKIKATPGIPGYNVNGTEIPSKPGKDVQLAAGKNVELIDDNTVAMSTSRGHVILSGNKIMVSSIYEVNGDVDFSTGNVEFNGSVIIKGSLREGFRVAAEGDVEVMNTIADGIVECSGSLRVKNGIVGKKTSIKAGGSIYTRFIENAQAEAGEDIIVGEAIMHSRVGAKKSVTVGGKGVIVGGIIRAGEEISCNIVGSHLATHTELEAGINPELRQEYARLLKEKEAVELDNDKASKASRLLKHLQETQGGLDQDKLAMLVRVNRALVQFAGDLERLNEAVSKMEEQIQHSERGKIMVQGVIHAGVKVSIGSAQLFIHDDYPFACLTKDGADIKINPYR